MTKPKAQNYKPDVCIFLGAGGAVVALMHDNATSHYAKKVILYSKSNEIDLLEPSSADAPGGGGNRPAGARQANGGEQGGFSPVAGWFPVSRRGPEVLVSRRGPQLSEVRRCIGERVLDPVPDE